MEKKEKLKLCPYCDGRVMIDATECPYCGEAFGEGLSQEKPRVRRLDDSLASAYEPPYIAKSHTKPGVPHPIPTRREQAAAPAVQEEPEEAKQSLLALILLSVGANLFTLGWLLFFFSDRGKLTLEWKSRYWPLYVLSSLVPLYYGLRSLKKK